MNIVPENKMDMEACRYLSQASSEEVDGQVSALLQWLKDMNWPVAPCVCKRLKEVGKPLVEPVREILKGTDEIWKYWVITRLLAESGIEVVSALKPELKRIVDAPTKLELSEGVNLVAEEVLGRCPS